MCEMEHSNPDFSFEADVDLTLRSRLHRNTDENNNCLDDDMEFMKSCRHSNPDNNNNNMNNVEVKSSDSNSNSKCHKSLKNYKFNNQVFYKSLLLFLLLPTVLILVQVQSVSGSSLSSTSSLTSNSINSAGSSKSTVKSVNPSPNPNANQRQFQLVYPNAPQVPSTLSTPLYPPYRGGKNVYPSPSSSPSLSTPATLDPINHSLENTVNTGDNKMVKVGSGGGIDHAQFVGDFLKTEKAENWEVQKSNGHSFSYVSTNEQVDPGHILHEHLPQAVALYQNAPQHNQHEHADHFNMDMDMNADKNVYDDGVNENIQPDAQSLTLHIHPHTTISENPNPNMNPNPNPNPNMNMNVMPINPILNQVRANPSSMNPNLNPNPSSSSSPTGLVNKMGGVYPNDLYEITDPQKPPKSIADRIFVRHSTRKKIRLPVYTNLWSSHKIIPDPHPHLRHLRNRGRRPPPGRGRGRRRSRGKRRPRGPGKRPRGRGKRGRGRRPPPHYHNHHIAGSSQLPAFAPAFVSYGPIYGNPPGIDLQHGNIYGLQSQQNLAIASAGIGPTGAGIGSGPGMGMVGPSAPPPQFPMDYMTPPVGPPKIPYAPPMVIHPFYQQQQQQQMQQQQNQYHYQPNSYRGNHPALTISLEAPSNEYPSAPLSPHGQLIGPRPMYAHAPQNTYANPYAQPSNLLPNPSPTFGPPRPAHLYPMPMNVQGMSSPPHFQLNYAQQSRPQGARYIPPHPHMMQQQQQNPHMNGDGHMPLPPGHQQGHRERPPMNFGHPMHNFGPPGSSLGQPPPFMDHHHPKDPWQQQPPTRYGDMRPGHFSQPRQIYPTAPSTEDTYPPPAPLPHKPPYNEYAPNFHGSEIGGGGNGGGEDFHFKENSGFGFPPNNQNSPSNIHDGFLGMNFGKGGNPNAGKSRYPNKERERDRRPPPPQKGSGSSPPNFFEDEYGGKSSYWSGKESDFHPHSDSFPPSNLYDDFDRSKSNSKYKNNNNNNKMNNNNNYGKDSSSSGSYSYHDHDYHDDDRNYKYGFGKAKLSIGPSQSFAFEDIDNHRSSKSDNYQDYTNNNNNNNNINTNPHSNSNLNSKNNNNIFNNKGSRATGPSSPNFKTTARPRPSYDTNYNSPGMSKDPKITGWTKYTDDLPLTDKVIAGYTPYEKRKSTKYSTLPDLSSLETGAYKPDAEHSKYPKLTYDSDSLIKRILPKNSKGPAFLTEEKKHKTFKSGYEFKKMLNEHDKMRI